MLSFPGPPAEGVEPPDGNEPGAGHGEDVGSMRLLRRLYAKRGFSDPTGAMVADGLLLAVVAVAALAVLAAI